MTDTRGLIIAGLLVGYSTVMGSGCTSGHAVCGLSRFSKRSLVSTVILMAFGFLNVVKNWESALMFVMIGAIPVNMLAYRWIKNWQQPLFDQKFHVPTSQLITKELVIGAILFGIGWGIAGYCPGPAITSLASLQPGVFIFVISMLIGMFAYQKLNSNQSR